MKTNRKSRKMVCLRCEHTEFAATLGEVQQVFRGATLQVQTPVMRCAHCGWETLGAGQLDGLRIATADAYRVSRGLLTSIEIRAIRESAGLSQRAFAAALSVGPASIPRWESWQVQEPVYDAKLREFARSGSGWSGSSVVVFITHHFTQKLPVPAWQDAQWANLARISSAQAPETNLLVGTEAWAGPTLFRVLGSTCQRTTGQVAKLSTVSPYDALCTSA